MYDKKIRESVILACSSCEEAYEIGINVGLLCQARECYVIPKIYDRRDPRQQSKATVELIGETASGFAICLLDDGREILVQPSNLDAAKIKIGDFCMLGAYRIGILAGVAVANACY